jgi:hypothetical protein
MGEVYRARDTRLQREVAIKVPPEHLANDSAALARFEREGRAIAALSHPTFSDPRHRMRLVVTELLKGARQDSAGVLPWRALPRSGWRSPTGSRRPTARSRPRPEPENVFLTTDGRVKIRLGWPGTGEESGSPDNTWTDTEAVIGRRRRCMSREYRGRRPDARSDIFASRL